MDTTKRHPGGAKYPVGITLNNVRDLTERGLSASQIAAALGISRAAVYQHRKRLAELKEDEA